MSSPMNNNAGPSGRVGNKLPPNMKLGQINQFDDQQTGLYNRGFDQIGPDSYLSKLSRGDQGTFDQLEAPALRQFNELQGGIASRFSQGGGGRGSMSNRRSSGFQNTMNSASSQFAQQLQSQRQSLMRQAQQDIWGMSQDLLNQRPYEQFMYEKQKNPWGTILGKSFGPVGGLIGDLATGDKQYEGTQAGVDTSLDLVKAFLSAGGKAAGGG
jgi:hypothetical protein